MYSGGVVLEYIYRGVTAMAKKRGPALQLSVLNEGKYYWKEVDISRWADLPEDTEAAAGRKVTLQRFEGLKVPKAVLTVCVACVTSIYSYVYEEEDNSYNAFILCQQTLQPLIVYATLQCRCINQCSGDNYQKQSLCSLNSLNQSMLKAQYTAFNMLWFQFKLPQRNTVLFFLCRCQAAKMSQFAPKATCLSPWQLLC